MTSRRPESAKPGHLSLGMLGAPGAILIDYWAIEPGAGTTYLLTNPSAVIVCDSHERLPACLQSIADYQAQGKYVAGYIAYDAGVGLDKPLQSRHQPRVPLLWMGVYDTCTELNRADARFAEWDPSDRISSAQLNVPDTEYISRVERIQRYIEAGDVYQVNYTCKLRFTNSGTAAGLFARLREAHPVCHSAFVNTGDFQVISLSPELFLRLSDGRLSTRPMKGTSRRGRSSEEDILLASSLHNDEKNRAENLMIVDLMRNDLGRVCGYGSIVVSDMFRVERYRSVLQMTSVIEGTVRSGLNAADVLKAAFPPGSVTGAPKSRAIEIIDELERESRGVYCGAIGIFKPGGDFLLNVAIRTIVQRDGLCELGVGSGIVADSDPELELWEVLLKGRFVEAEPIKFDLLETLLYDTKTGYAYLSAHIARMLSSASYFGYALSEQAIRETLAKAEADIKSSHPDGGRRFRVRLLSTECGRLRTECREIETSPSKPIRLLLAQRRIDPEDVFLYHKTTNREAYDSDLADANARGFTDMVYTNAHGHLTECVVTNVAVRLKGRWYTPPVECGLLPGIWRADLLQSGGADERVLTLDDLAEAEEVTIGNSVRGTIRVDSVCSPDGRIVFMSRAK